MAKKTTKRRKHVNVKGNVKGIPIVIPASFVKRVACTDYYNLYRKTFHRKKFVPFTVGNLLKLYGAYLKSARKRHYRYELDLNSRLYSARGRFINHLSNFGVTLLSSLITGDDEFVEGYISVHTVKVRKLLEKGVDKMKRGSFRYRDVKPKFCQKFIRQFVALVYKVRSETLFDRILPGLLARGLTVLRESAVMPQLVNRAFVSGKGVKVSMKKAKVWRQP